MIRPAPLPTANVVHRWRLRPGCSGGMTAALDAHGLAGGAVSAAPAVGGRLDDAAPARDRRGGGGGGGDRGGGRGAPRGGARGARAPPPPGAGGGGGGWRRARRGVGSARAVVLRAV